MSRSIFTRSTLLSASVLLLVPCALRAQTTPAQTTPAQQLNHAYALEREGRPAAAIAEVQPLLDSAQLDAASAGKAWNVLGLAYTDQDDFAGAQHAYEQSVRMLERLPDSVTNCAMALDDFGQLYLMAGQLDASIRLRTRALQMYEQAGDHGGIARAYSHLAGIAFTRGDAGGGRKLLKRAVAEARSASDLDDDDRAAIESLKGWEAQLTGDAGRSAASYRHELDLLRRRHGEEHRSVGWAYVLLGKSEAALEQWTPALDEMRHGLAILDHTAGQQSREYLTAELAYARVLNRAGLRSEASQIQASAEAGLEAISRAQGVAWTVPAASFR